ncbi:MAG: hypothetical protein COA99_01795 [Moraxellaceae bacterium]|nr:MAG: hypothetical protein COA99_01795 [Moraxellaceae bacterium]
MTDSETQQDRKLCKAINPLIPWHANNTLSLAESAQVESHLKHCTACGEAFQLFLSIAGAAQADQAINCHSDQLPVKEKHFSDLMDRIDHYEKDATAKEDSVHKLPVGSLRSPFQFSYLQGIAASFAIVFMFASGSYFMPTDTLFGKSGSVDYHTLTDTPITSASATGELQYKVLFKASVTPNQITHFFADIDANVASGPSKRGVYTIGLASEMLNLLRTDPIILVAEPIVK